MDTTTTLIEQIQARGERVTVPRRLVIEALGQSHQHLTIGDIQRQIQEHSHTALMSDTTVYRVLQWLKDLGLVSQTDMGQTGTVYALMRGPHHHHLICLTCGKITTIDDSLFNQMRERLRQDYGFESRIDHMAIYGLCQNCAQQTTGHTGT